MYSEAYIHYLIELHLTRDWFECHEIMEEAWKEETDPELKLLWLALIRLAVGLYHERRGNAKGAQAMYERLLKTTPSLNWTRIGVDKMKLHSFVHTRHEQIMSRMQTHTKNLEIAELQFELPIVDRQLIFACEEKAQAMGKNWHDRSFDVDDAIIHRHRERDRSDVIAARLEALNKRASQ